MSLPHDLITKVCGYDDAIGLVLTRCRQVVGVHGRIKKDDPRKYELDRFCLGHLDLLDIENHDYLRMWTLSFIGVALPYTVTVSVVL